MLWGLIATGSCVLASVRIRRRLLPDVDAGTTAIATIVIALGFTITTAQLLGAVGLLTPIASFLALVAVSLVAVVSCRTVGDGAGETAADRRSGDRSGERLPDRLAVVALLAGVGAQWSAHLADALRRGMLHADNLWYHGPFVATIRRTGGFGSFDPFGYPESRFFPLNSHVLDALLTMPAGNDVLVPFVNHGAAALALASAWLIGRRLGVAESALAGVLAVLSLPLIATTQSGQMYNDLFAAALVLAAVALWLGADLSAGPVRWGSVLAALALGLAASTKLPVVVPVAVLLIGIVAVDARAGRRRSAAIASAVFVMSAGVWFVRNLAVAGSPIPYASLHVGPIGFERQTPPNGSSLFGTLGRLDEFGRYYLDSIDISFGPLWPLVVIATVVAPVAIAVDAGRDVRVRVVAAAAALGMITFPAMPLTGGLPFVNNLRYALGSLLLGAVAVAWWAGTSAVRSRIVIAGAGAVVVADLLSEHRGRVPAWPDDQWVVAAIVAIAIAGVGVAVASLDRAGRDVVGRLPATQAPVTVTIAVTAVAIAALVAAVAVAAPGHDDRWYARGGTPDAEIYALLLDQPDRRVDVIGAEETLPYFGPGYDREVHLHNDVLSIVASPTELCAEVRRRLDSPGPSLIVVTSFFTMRDVTPLERATWFEADPAVEPIATTDRGAVYRRTGPLDPATCP